MIDIIMFLKELKILRDLFKLFETVFETFSNMCESNELFLQVFFSDFYFSDFSDE